MTYPSNVAGVAADQLRSIVERIERLKEEVRAINGDVSDVYKEAKSNGFNVPAIKEIVRLRSKDSNEVAEQEAILDLYKSALNMGGADAV
jgi:uncharacterized protein (UPF0335 family)